ncbi:MAG: hypothetical protein ACJ764_08465 [Solirubrobacteraceae bacterium]
MRRFIISGAALAALVGGGVAFAASSDFNSYKATETFSPSAAGSPAHPSPFAVSEAWTAHGNNGHNTAPLTRIVAKIYGEKTDAKDFPKCTAKMINSAGNSRGWNKVCPKGSLIGKGPVKSVFVPASNASASNPPQCNPYLTIYNGGPGTYKGKPVNVQVFFFEEYPYAPGPQYSCLNGAVKTGAAAAYNGYSTNASSANHNTWSIDIPLPPNVSTSAGGIHGVYASLVKLNVTYGKLTKRVHGHVKAYGASIGCKNGKRPYSFTFYAKNYQGESPPTQKTTISHVANC